MHPSDAHHVPLRDALVGAVLRGTGNVAYHLRECIGEGGQGWVFRASWGDPAGHAVIVKVLRPDVIASEALARFKREAEVLRRLGAGTRPNPHIVRFYDHAVARVPSPYGPEPVSLPFTVLEYVDGTTLEHVLAEQAKTGRGLPPGRVRRLLRQICHALEIVHEQRIVHRDLKPSNILLATEAGDEIAKVTDFGLVKLVDVNFQRTTALAGASLGYAPPEQYERGNERVSPRTDVFSLAAVVFEALAGRPAFPFIDGENPLLIITRILTGPRPSLAKARASLAPELTGKPALVEALDRELARALAADPNARHASVTELLQALEPPLRAASEPPVRAPVSPFEATVRSNDAPGPAVVLVVDDARPASAFEPTRPVAQQSGPIRDPAIEAHAATPDAWTFQTLTAPGTTSALEAAAFAGSGDAVALGAAGLFRWADGRWSREALPAEATGHALRGLRAMRDGGLLLFGEGGFVARRARDGAITVWRVPASDITFLGALVEDTGVTTLVGERPSRTHSSGAATTGVLAQFEGDRITVIADAAGTTRLHGAARLASGELVACGDGGALFRVERGVVELVAAICAGNLLAIAASPAGGAVTVGTGGHALSIGPGLEARLEPVQTTRDIGSLTIATDGVAWAGSAKARILRRSVLDGQTRWVRISGAIGVTSTMLALMAEPTRLRAIGADGAVVEGRLAR